MFECDPQESEANLSKHGIDFQASQALWNDSDRVEFTARFHDENRHGIIAQLSGKLWTAIFTTREDRIRIISVRRSRENEQRLYHNRSGI
jgi:uncharacterized DUF497 family protein